MAMAGLVIPRRDGTCGRVLPSPTRLLRLTPQPLLRKRHGPREWLHTLRVSHVASSLATVAACSSSPSAAHGGLGGRASAKGEGAADFIGVLRGAGVVRILGRDGVE